MKINGWVINIDIHYFYGHYCVFIVSITIADDLSIAIGIIPSNVILAKDIFREHEILVRLERTVLFVNWVICGISVLSLHADSIVRSPFLFRVILH